MSTNSAQEQAEEIHDRLSSDPNVGLPDGVQPEDFLPAIDPEKPMPVNLKAVADSYRADADEKTGE